MNFISLISITSHYLYKHFWDFFCLLQVYLQYFYWHLFDIIFLFSPSMILCLSFVYLYKARLSLVTEEFEALNFRLVTDKFAS